MANYINSNIICQAYIHIDPVEIGDDRLELLQQELGLFITTRGRFFLYDDVDTDVELKAGSLKVYATIFGAHYIAIGQYGSFRSGVNFLAQDTKRLAECIASESLYLSQSRHKNTLRVEARTGVAGKLKTVIDALENISSDLDKVDAQTSSDKLNETTDKLLTLLDTLNDPKDPAYIKSNICELITSWFPKNPPPRQNIPHTIKGITSYGERRKAIIRVVSK